MPVLLQLLSCQVLLVEQILGGADHALSAIGPHRLMEVMVQKCKSCFLCDYGHAAAEYLNVLGQQMLNFEAKDHKLAIVQCSIR